MNVLVYSGADTAPSSLAHTFASLRTLLSPNYAVQPVDLKALKTQPWHASCALLVLPPFQPSSAPSPFPSATSEEMQKYVTGGGKLLALGTGVRVVARRGRGMKDVPALSAQLANVRIGGPEACSVPAKLTLEDSGADGLALSLVPSLQSEEKDAVTPIRLADGTRLEGVFRTGAVDIPRTEASSERVKSLAHYVRNDASEVAAIRASIGRGFAAFWSAHVEAPIATDSAQEETRLRTLQTTLEGLDLRLPDKASEYLRAVPRPTPQILCSAPWRAGVVDTIMRALEIPDLASAAAPYNFKDNHDAFLFHPQEYASSVFAEQCEAVKSLSDDPATWNPKHIILYGDKAMPFPELTPKFNIGTYYEKLKKARDERGFPETYKDGVWGIGEALLYGEIVTSTQTMLDKLVSSPHLSVLSLHLMPRPARSLEIPACSWHFRRHSSPLHRRSSLGADAVRMSGCRLRGA